MNKKILGIGVLTLLVIVGIVLIPGASSLPAYAGGASAHITAAAPGCAGGCHNMPVFCARCHAYPYATPTPTPVVTPTPTPVVTPTPTPVVTPTPTPVVTPTPTPVVTPTPTPVVTPTPTATPGSIFPHPADWRRNHEDSVEELGVSACTGCHSIDPSTKGQAATPLGPSCWNCHGAKWESDGDGDHDGDHDGGHDRDHDGDHDGGHDRDHDGDHDGGHDRDHDGGHR